MDLLYISKEKPPCVRPCDRADERLSSFAVREAQATVYDSSERMIVVTTRLAGHRQQAWVKGHIHMSGASNPLTLSACSKSNPLDRCLSALTH